MRTVALQQLTDQREAFELDLKHSLDIKDFYTSLTGESFQNVRGRLRARNVWRDDNEPSLAYFDGQPHCLTDFGESWEDGSPKTYDALDILMATQHCVSKQDAVVWLSEKLNKEIPDGLYKGAAKGLGGVIKRVWDLCREEMDDFLKTRRHQEVSDYFARRDIPADPIFLTAVNLGLCPDVRLLAEAINGTTNKNAPQTSYSQKAIAYPLYNHAGVLAGIKFRLAAGKGFHLWDPTGQPVFYNFNRFPKRPTRTRIKLVEGESNLVAYAIAAYRQYMKEGKKDAALAESLDLALYDIYCTGSKSNNIDSLRGKFPDVLYFPDWDQAEADKYTDIIRHPVLETASKVAGILESSDFMVMDWSQLGDVFDKFDLADYLKSIDYDIRKLEALKISDIYDMGCGIIEKIATSIPSKNNRDAARHRMIGRLNAKLERSQSVVMDKVCKPEDETAPQSVSKRARTAKWHTYSINDKGHIIQALFDDAGNFAGNRDVTNFYVQIKHVIAEYDVYTREKKKRYRLELMRNGIMIGSGLAAHDDVIDAQKLHAFVAGIGDVHSCECGPKGWGVVKELMNAIPPELNIATMTNLGRPPFEDEIERLIGGTRYCFMPNVSVIKGEIVENKTIDVSLQPQKELQSKARSNYGWRIISDEQAKEAANLFWHHLLHVHSMHVMTSLVALIYDGATREMMGDGSVVPNGHGFPIYLEGVSGSHKTTATIYAMNLLGEFSEQQDLFDWQNTANYIETLFMKCGTMVAAMDELKNELFSPEDFIRIFNTLYGGSTKGRMTASAETTGDVKVSCSAIITSEAKPFHIPESIASRIIIFRVPRSDDREVRLRKTHMDALDVHIMLDGCAKPRRFLLHGLMPRMVAWEQSRLGQPYVETLKKWHAHYVVKAVGLENTYRIVHMVTRLVSAFERMCDFLVEHGYVARADADAKLRDYVSYWDTGISEQARQVKDRASGTNIAKYIGELIESKRLEIGVYDSGTWSYFGNTTSGIVLIDAIYPDVGRKILVAAPHALYTIINKLSGFTYSDVSSRLKGDGVESGLVEAEPRQVPPGCKFCEDSAKFMCIDYNKLMVEYNSTKVPRQ